MATPKYAIIRGPSVGASLLRPTTGISKPFATAFLSRRSFSSYLVAPNELNEALKKNPPSKISPEPRVIPLCASWFLPDDAAGRTGIETFRKLRIPKARFWDIDKVVDRHSSYPHMLPSEKDFASAMSELGIRKEDTVVVYDTKELGIFSAPRVAWTLRVFNHPKVHILNNFKVWVEQELPTESGEFYSVECCTYQIPEMNTDMVAEFERVREVAQDYNKEGREGVQIIDARAAGRFEGTAGEPRPGIPSGHMPGAINIPFGAVLDPNTKAFLPGNQLRELFLNKGVNPNGPVIATCGTGVSACVLETALSEAGIGEPGTRTVYDGSWTEWAQRVKPADGLVHPIKQ